MVDRDLQSRFTPTQGKTLAPSLLPLGLSFSLSKIWDWPHYLQGF